MKTTHSVLIQMEIKPYFYCKGLGSNHHIKGCVAISLRKVEDPGTTKKGGTGGVGFLVVISI